MRYNLPTIPTGFEIEPTHGMFSVVFPTGNDNLIKNPSVEYNAVGHSVYQAAYVRSIDEQRRGAFSIQVSTLTDGTSINQYGTYYTIDLEAGKIYTFSVDLKGVAGYEYSLRVSPSGGVHLKTAEKKFIANGKWQREYITFGAASAGIYYLGVYQTTKLNSVFYTDGYQCEVSPRPTSYFDGSMSWFDNNQLFYNWKGSPHASVSHRASFCNSGGIEYSFAELGLHVVSVIGLGMPPVRIIADDMTSGRKLYHKSQYTSREFSIICQLYGKDLNDLNKKKTLIEKCFRHDNTFPDQQPMVLKYAAYDENGDTISDHITISCLYEGGLEGLLENPFSERFEIRMAMVDQFLTSESEYAQEVGSTSYVGNWSFVKGNWYGLYTQIANIKKYDIGDEFIRVIRELPSGKIFVGGLFEGIYTQVQTPLYPYTAFLYDPNTETFEDAGHASGGVNSTTYCAIPWTYTVESHNAFTGESEVIKDEDAIIAGTHTGVKMRFNGTWTVIGATNGPVYDIVQDKAGHYYVSGTFTTIGGVACNRIAKYEKGVWKPILTGATGDAYAEILKMDIFNDVIYITTNYSTTALFGITTSAEKIMKLDVSPSNTKNNYAIKGLLPALPYTQYEISNVEVEIVDGVVYAIIQIFDNVLEYYSSKVYSLSGNSWKQLLSLNDDLFGPYHLYSGYNSRQKRNLLYVYGSKMSRINNADLNNDSPVLYLDGNDWIPINCLSVTGADAFSLDREGSFYMAMSHYFDSPNLTGCTIRVDSKELVYPKFRINGPGTLWYIETPVTKQRIRFKPYVLHYSETLDIDTDPGNKVFYSSLHGDVSKKLYKGSGSVVSLRHGINYLTVMMSDNYLKKGTSSTVIGDVTLGNVSVENTDDGQLYVKVVSAGGGLYSVEFYKNAITTELVAKSVNFSVEGRYDVNAMNGSMLSGSVTYVGTPAAATGIIIRYGLAVMTWKKRYLSLHEAGLPWQTI
jgi:hypothetical protein